MIKTYENGDVREKICVVDIAGSIAGIAVNSDEEIIVGDQSYRKIVIFKKL